MLTWADEESQWKAGSGAGPEGHNINLLLEKRPQLVGEVMVEKSPLFSTYRVGENRVTASMMAVFERIEIGTLERILAAASEESELPFVEFTNQYAGEAPGVPDASIAASFHYLFEVKTASNAVDGIQLKRHLHQFADNHQTHQRLFVITPDTGPPRTADELGDKRVVWFSFAQLSEAIDGVLAEFPEDTTDRERFLLRELQDLFAHEGLTSVADVLVVPARVAYPIYLQYSAYVCQPDRSFRDVPRFGFYADGAIQPHIPKIRHVRRRVHMTYEEASALKQSEDPLDQEIGSLVERLLDDGTQTSGEYNQIMLLTEPGDDETLELERPIKNTLNHAYTQAQRYTHSRLLLRSPDGTAQLLEWEQQSAGG